VPEPRLRIEGHGCVMAMNSTQGYTLRAACSRAGTAVAGGRVVSFASPRWNRFPGSITRWVKRPGPLAREE